MVYVSRRVAGTRTCAHIACAVLVVLAALSRLLSIFPSPIQLKTQCQPGTVFIGVFSGIGPSYSKRRELLRATWFPDANNVEHFECVLGLAFKFVVGRPSINVGKAMSQSDFSALQHEFERDDYMVLDVTDSYRNLPAKTAAFFQTVIGIGPFQYVLKIDDDMFLSPPHLAVAAHQWYRMQAGYIGCMHKPDNVFTSPGESRTTWANLLRRQYRRLFRLTLPPRTNTIQKP